MISVTKADDRHRISIPGTTKGKQYMVHHEAAGWWIPRETKPKKAHGPKTITFTPVPDAEIAEFYKMDLPREWTDDQLMAMLPKKDPR